MFETVAREIKKAGLTKLLSAERLKAESDSLVARKTALQSELRKVQQERKSSIPPPPRCRCYASIAERIETLKDIRVRKKLKHIYP